MNTEIKESVTTEMLSMICDKLTELGTETNSYHGSLEFDDASMLIGTLRATILDKLKASQGDKKWFSMRANLSYDIKRIFIRVAAGMRGY